MNLKSYVNQAVNTLANERTFVQKVVAYVHLFNCRIKHFVYSSPVGFLFAPLVITPEIMTEQMIRCRAAFENAIVNNPNIDTSVASKHLQTLEQMEWEHVAYLREKGLDDGGNPYIVWKTSGKPFPVNWKNPN